MKTVLSIIASDVHLLGLGRGGCGGHFRVGGGFRGGNGRVGCTGGEEGVVRRRRSEGRGSPRGSPRGRSLIAVKLNYMGLQSHHSLPKWMGGDKLAH